MMKLSQAALAMEGKLIGADVEFSRVSTDSRAIKAGDLFIALKGENFDGAQFVAQAARDGAVAAVVNAGSMEGTAPCPVVTVPDTRLALGKLAANWRAQFTIPVVALTGSNGKTTVKEMLASILRAHIEMNLPKPQAKQDQGGKEEATRHTAGGSRGANDAANAEIATHEAWDAVLATQGNLNNDIGMPLTLLNLRKQHRYAVIEMGMNHPGEIDYLTCLARPNVAIVTNAASAHLAGLGTVEAVAQAKGEIFAGLGDNGVAVINADDQYAALWRGQAGKHRVIGFALDAEADVSACWDVTPNGIQMEIATPQGAANVRLQVPGAHNARNALAAAAAASALYIPLPAIVRGLEKFGGVAGRLQRKSARNGAALIDDTYNANPDSMRAALKVLAQAPGRRIFVMGDMGELGADAARLHAEIGAEAKRFGIQRLLALGELSREAVREFGADAQHCASIEELCAELDKELGAGTTILVKGSRFMKMERVVKHCCSQQEETCCSH